MLYSAEPWISRRFDVVRDCVLKALTSLKNRIVKIMALSLNRRSLQIGKVCLHCSYNRRRLALLVFSATGRYRCYKLFDWFRDAQET